jgi:hypothetical protein
MASATVTVTRRKVFEYSKAPFEILFDDKVVGSVSQAQTVELQVDPGHHTLQLRSRRGGLSYERSFDASDGQVINFSTRGTWILGFYLFSPWQPGRGLSLDPE